MKIVKALLIIAGLLIGLLVLLVVIGLNMLDAGVRKGIELGGSHATGVETTLAAADVRIRDQAFSMEGLKIANPAGYDSEHFIALGSGAVDVDDVFANPVLVPTLTLSDIDLIIDHADGKRNYEAILDHMGGNESGDRPTEPAAGDPRTLIVDTLLLENIRVRVLNAPGLSQVTGDLEVLIPEVKLTGVGSNGSGIGFSQLTSVVIKAVLTAAIKNGGGILPQNLLDNLGGELAGLDALADLGIDPGDLAGTVERFTGQVQDAAQDAIDGVQEQAQEQIDGAVEDATNKAKDALGGLLGGNKDD